MPGERVSMRKIRELLRLRWEHHLSQRSIGRSLGLSQGSVSDYLNRARRAGLTWPLPVELDDTRLEALLFPPPPDVPLDRRPVPDWARVHRDLRRPNVTLALLWDEYHPPPADGFGYSGSAKCIAHGPDGWSRRCARSTLRESGCSSTSPVTPWK